MCDIYTKHSAAVFLELYSAGVFRTPQSLFSNSSVTVFELLSHFVTAPLSLKEEHLVAFVPIMLIFTV